MESYDDLFQRDGLQRSVAVVRLNDAVVLWCWCGGAGVMSLMAVRSGFVSVLCLCRGLTIFTVAMIPCRAQQGARPAYDFIIADTERQRRHPLTLPGRRSG